MSSSTIAGKVLILGFAKPTPFTMEVVTDELIERGAYVLSRTKLTAGMMGFVCTREDTTRIACQVVTQDESAREDGYFRTHLNVFAGPQFWGLSASADEAAPVPCVESADLSTTSAPVEDGIELAVDEIEAFTDSERMLRLWLTLTEELEAQGVLSKAELVEALREIARQSTVPVRESCPAD